jgi:hypothetical protein
MRRDRRRVTFLLCREPDAEFGVRGRCVGCEGQPRTGPGLPRSISGQAGAAMQAPPNGTKQMKTRGLKAVQSRADARAADLAPIIRRLQAAGTTTLAGIAAALNARGIPTARGRGPWHAVQVSRVLVRIAE